MPDVLNTDVYNEVIRLLNEDPFETAQHMATEEVLLIGISPGGAV